MKNELEVFDKLQDMLKKLSQPQKIDWEEREKRCIEEQKIIYLWKQDKWKEEYEEEERKNKEKRDMIYLGILSNISTKNHMTETEIFNMVKKNEVLLDVIESCRIYRDFCKEIGGWIIRDYLENLCDWNYITRTRGKKNRIKYTKWKYIKYKFSEIEWRK